MSERTPTTWSLEELTRLTSRAGSLEELAGLGFDFIIEQPLAAWLSPREAVQLAAQLFDPTHASGLIEELLPQVIEGVQRRSSALGETPRDWLTPELDMELRALCARPLQLRPEQLKAWVHHELTEHVMRELVREVLDQFIKAAQPGGQGGGLVGAASRGALGFASKFAQRASQGVGGVLGGALQGLGDQLEAHLRSLTTDFIKTSMQGLLERLAFILSAPEVALKLGAARLELYDGLLKEPLSELMQRAEELKPEGEGLAEWARLSSELVAHHLNREALQEALIAELELALERFGERPLKLFLGGEERLTELRASLARQSAPQLQRFMESEPFQAWLKRALSEPHGASQSER